VFELSGFRSRCRIPTGRGSNEEKMYAWVKWNFHAPGKVLYLQYDILVHVTHLKSHWSDEDLEVRPVVSWCTILDFILELALQEERRIVRADERSRLTNLTSLPLSIRMNLPALELTLPVIGPLLRKRYSNKETRKPGISPIVEGRTCFTLRSCLSLKLRLTLGWSTKFAPTPGRSRTTGMFLLLSWSAGPIPESNKSYSQSDMREKNWQQWVGNSPEENELHQHWKQGFNWGVEQKDTTYVTMTSFLTRTV